MCYSPRGLKKSDTTERLNGTEVRAAAGLCSRSRRLWGVTGLHLGFSECSWGPEGAAASCVPTGTVCPWGRPVSRLLSVQPDPASPPLPLRSCPRTELAPSSRLAWPGFLVTLERTPPLKGFPQRPCPTLGHAYQEAGSWLGQEQFKCLIM